MARQREPGWYSDPDAPGHWRWWDGESWTDHAVSAYRKQAEGPSGPGKRRLGHGERRPGGDLTEPGIVGTTGPGSVGTTGPGNVDAGVSGPTARGAPGGDNADPVTDDVTTPMEEGLRDSAGAGGTDELPAAPGGAAGAAEGAGERTGSPRAGDGRPPGRDHPHPRPAGGTAVFARRWAALATVVAVVVIVLAIALHGHGPALYWQGEPLANGQRALTTAEVAMRDVAAADEGVLAPQSRCYFSLATRSSHDVSPYLRCGPVLLPWSKLSQPWLRYDLSGRLTGSSEKLSVVVRPAPADTTGLSRREVLRRPDGATVPTADAGLAVPAVPRQQPGWGGVLGAPPGGLPSAPVADFIGDWGQSYRLVAFGEVSRLSAKLDEAALRAAVNPPGSAWSTGAGGAGRPGSGGSGSTSGGSGSAVGGSRGAGSGGGTRPLAPLLLPTEGQVFVVAELATSVGEAGGPVPSQANGNNTGTADQPTLEVLGGGPAATFPTRATSGAASVTVVASVPIGSKPALEITDKGLLQQVSLADGRMSPGPSILTRAGTNEALSVSGAVDGATVRVSDASLVWFAGSDGGTVPPNPDDAYLQVLASATPTDFFPPASDFTLRLPGGQVLQGQALPDSDRQAIVMGFVVPASFSDGTVVVSASGHSFDVPVHFA